MAKQSPKQKQKQKRQAREAQTSFAGNAFTRPIDCFGGSLLKNSHAKCKRPLESKLPIHLVMRSNLSRMRMPKTYGPVNEIVRNVARKYGVRIYQFANLGNHLHLLIKIPSPRAWGAFIRELSGRVAQVAQGLSGQEKGQKFWRQRPFTRIVRGWQKAFRTIKEYVALNILEAEGFISRKETKTLKDLRLIFADG